MTIQKQKLPAFQELGQDIEASRDAHQSHKGKDNGNGLSVLDNEDTHEEDNLQKGVEVDSSSGDILGVGSLWILAGLLEEEKETVPELNARH